MPHGVSRIEELSVTDIRHKPSLVILTHLVGDRVKGVAAPPGLYIWEAVHKLATVLRSLVLVTGRESPCSALKGHF